MKRALLPLVGLAALAGACLLPILGDPSPLLLLGLAAVVSIGSLGLMSEPRRLFAPIGAGITLLALSACSTVEAVIVPPDTSASVAALSCEDAGTAFGTAASNLAALGVAAVLSGGFEQIVSTAESIVSGNVTGANAEIIATAGTVLALRNRLDSCPEIEVEVVPT